MSLLRAEQEQESRREQEVEEEEGEYTVVHVGEELGDGMVLSVQKEGLLVYQLQQ